MSTAMPMQPQAQFFAEPPKSKGCGLVGFLGCGCAVMLLLCCGGGGLFFFLMYNSIQTSYTTDPAAVVEISNSIAEFDVPANMNPESAIASNLLVLKNEFKVAIYTNNDQDQMLALVERGDFNGDVDGLLNLAVIGMPSKPHPMHSYLTPRPVVHRQIIDLPNKQLQLLLSEVIDLDTQSEYWKGQCDFVGRNGPAAMVFWLPKEKYSLDDLRRIVESIR